MEGTGCSRCEPQPTKSKVRKKKKKRRSRKKKKGREIVMIELIRVKREKIWPTPNQTKAEGRRHGEVREKGGKRKDV